ncbi:MAG: DUF2785 domain-containing protein [Deltaproteobacteria bacterium]|nr:DUF2785 domain-containing protein [Deltaproteobacteria bacterium]
MTRAALAFSRWTAALAAAALALSAQASAAAPATGEARGRAFWEALARDCAVPPGETTFGLAREAAGFVGSPDAFWRDEVPYGVFVACAYRRRALAPAERRALVAELSAGLHEGRAEGAPDGVLRRSYSALLLSILAAVEGVDPALDGPAYRRLLDGALAFLREERDLRGFDPRVGWVHAAAHGADLLKFLARDPRFERGDVARLLDAALRRMTAAGTPVFTAGEPERLAMALEVALRRADLDLTALDAWLARFPALEKEAFAPPLSPEKLAAAENARALLRALFVELSLPRRAPPGSAAPPASPGTMAARERVLGALQAIRR